MRPEPWIRYPGAWDGLPGGLYVACVTTVIAAVVCLAPSAVAFWLACVGRSRRLVLGGHIAYIVAGAVLIAIGVDALLTGQPPAIWINLLLLGGIFVSEMSLHLPLLIYFYRKASQRHSGRQSAADGQ